MNIRTTISLSLVAVCANALSLEQSIKNVDLDGFLRYRYDTTRVKDIALTQPAHKIRLDYKLSLNLADNYKANAVFRYDTKSFSYSNNAYINTNDNFHLKEANLTYINFNTSFSFGRLKVPSMFNDGVLVTSFLIDNHSLDNTNINAYFVDNFDLSESSLINEKAINQISYKIPLKATNLPKNLKLQIYNQNLYGLNINYHNDLINLTLGADYLNDFAIFYGVDLKSYLGDKKSYHYSFNSQLTSTSLKQNYKTSLNASNSVFYGVEILVGFKNFDFELGYINYGKKDKASFVTWHDKGLLLHSGKTIIDGFYGGIGKREYLYSNISYKYDNFNFLFSIIDGGVKLDLAKYKQTELMPKIVYKYSKKLKFSAFYDYAITKTDMKNIKTYKTRLEAKYSF